MTSAITVQESAAPYGKAMMRPTTEGERRVILHGVSWATYKALSKDLGDSRACRLAFDSGEMEIMSPYSKHGNSEFRIGQLVVVLSGEFGLPCIGLGALTCDRDDLQKSIEPDGCFYIQHAHLFEDIDLVDLKIHPPPDLMIEVDISTNSMKKLPICQALGVPEHWRFDGYNLEIRILKNGNYFESTESLIFPGLPLIE